MDPEETPASSWTGALWLGLVCGALGSGVAIALAETELASPRLHGVVAVCTAVVGSGAASTRSGHGVFAGMVAFGAVVGTWFAMDFAVYEGVWVLGGVALVSAWLTAWSGAAARGGDDAGSA